MKKMLFLLVSLVVLVSMNAQNVKVITILDGETELATCEVKSTIKVVFKDAPATTGTATRSGEVEVKWIQLWKGGPKFAEYNVGAVSETDYGGYYAWGGNQSKVDDHNTGYAVLSGDDDTATKLWGENWRMPTEEELQALLANCDVEWITVGGVTTGCKFTGTKAPYNANSIFLPAAGYCESGGVYGQNYGHYWSSTPNGGFAACGLDFGSSYHSTSYDHRNHGRSVRPVLVEIIK